MNGFWSEWKCFTTRLKAIQKRFKNKWKYFSATIFLFLRPTPKSPFAHILVFNFFVRIELRESIRKSSRIRSTCRKLMIDKWLCACFQSILHPVIQWCKLRGWRKSSQHPLEEGRNFFRIKKIQFLFIERQNAFWWMQSTLKT